MPLSHHNQRIMNYHRVIHRMNHLLTIKNQVSPQVNRIRIKIHLRGILRVQHPVLPLLVGIIQRLNHPQVIIKHPVVQVVSQIHLQNLKVMEGKIRHYHHLVKQKKIRHLLPMFVIEPQANL
ncbi:hypothetical protein BHY08_06680 [Vagococcus teuberi]|uniref:Uncharacterized protein n=1 Tax=Vagococcus teuberi TaxID=519472 RepID=A0A1J0A6H2_9ENTE|nr:hypothetical protein BHY08_06680 [Vagococcus teuberi]